MSCYCMMCRQTIVDFNKAKYTKVSSDVLEKVFSLQHECVSPNGKTYICTTYLTLCRRNMPLLSKANGLELTPVPHELSG